MLCAEEVDVDAGSAANADGASRLRGLLCRWCGFTACLRVCAPGQVPGVSRRGGLLRCRHCLRRAPKSIAGNLRSVPVPVSITRPGPTARSCLAPTGGAAQRAERDESD